MLIIVLAAGMLFVCVAALVIGLTTSNRQLKIEERKEELQANRPRVQMVESQLSRQLRQSFFQRVIQPMLRSINKKLVGLAPQGTIERTRKQLDAAGNPPGLTEPVFLLLRGVAMLMGAGAGMFLYTRALANAAPALHLLVPLIVVFMSCMIPDYMLGNKIKARQALIRKDLPDTLDLLVVSAEAGMGLDGAVAEVVRRKHGPLVDEFDRALLEIRLGKRRREAWQDMAERAQVDELSALVAALYQAQELGVSIAKALRAHSDALRNRRSMRIREAAAVLGTKMLFPLIFCIFPALFVVVLGPGVLSMKDAMGFWGGG